VPVRDDGATVTLTPLGPSAPGISLPTGANVPVAVPGLAAPGIAAAGDVVKVTATGPVLVFSAAAAGQRRRSGHRAPHRDERVRNGQGLPVSE
jgi:hypothetical protein